MASDRKKYMREYLKDRRGDPEKRKQDEARRVKRIEEKKRWVDSHKELCGCEVCKQENRPHCLDFHHRKRKDKDVHISRMLSTGYAKPAILLEMKKCMVVCKNCHAHIHWLERKKGND